MEVSELDALLAFMPPAVRELIGASFESLTFDFGQVVVHEGQPSDALYVVKSGRARVVTTDQNGDELMLHTLNAGDVFGEIGLLEQTTHSATVRSSSEVEVLRLDAAVVRGLVASNPMILEFLEMQMRRRNLNDFLRHRTSFGDLPPETLDALLRRLEPVTANVGEVLIREGDPIGPMFVVREGRLRARVGERAIAYYTAADHFGETSLFTAASRSATVEALTNCSLLRLTPGAFGDLLANHPAFRDQVEREIARFDYEATAKVPLDFAEEVLPAATASTLTLSDQVEDPAFDAEPFDAGPFSTEAGRFAKSGKRIRRFRHLWQVDEADCGAACLAMVCRHFGRAVSLARVRTVVRTGVDGSSLRGITAGAEELGLTARAVKASKGNLDAMPLPAVAHWEGNHWVVVCDVTAKRVLVADPALGMRRLKRADFIEGWSGYAALFEPTPAFDTVPLGGASYSWLWAMFAPHKKKLVIAGALALLVSALQLALPVFTQLVIDRVLPHHNLALLHVLVLSMAAVVIAMLAGSIGHRYLLSRIAVQVDGSAMDFMSSRMLALPMRYFYARRTGDIQRRLAGMQQVRTFVVSNGVVALTAFAELATTLVLMFVYSRLLAFVFLATTPLYVVMMRYASARMRPIFDSLEEAFGKYYSRQIDAIKGIEAVKAMGAEDLLRGQLVREFNGLRHKLFKADFTSMIYESGVQLVAFASLMIFLWIGSVQVLHGHLTIGELIAFNTLVVLANAPIIMLLGTWDQLQVVQVLLTRLSDVFEQEPEQGADHSQLRPVPTLAGTVSFENLGFQYGGPESAYILQGISFAVPAGTTVAIVGRSGSGKTTLVKCLAGLLEPTEGTIRYDGVDMTTLDYRQLRRLIGFVLQDNFLFSETIARNIAFGDEELDHQQIEWAARAANAHEFITRLPLRYTTRVGETGLLLSGGQRQRVAIARALYRRPPVLILDEATSSLDAESERAVQDNMERVLEGKTSFVIAHRLSTIRHADVILVLDKGRLVEHGNHDDLMARKGLYFYLSSQQLDL
jgi:ATP-binding cassette subfamily B protein